MAPSWFTAAPLEIHSHIEGREPSGGPAAVPTGLASVITRMVLLDIVFSLDSIITAIGMANELWVMATAVVITMIVMLAVATPVAEFINRHPTVEKFWC